MEWYFIIVIAIVAISVWLALSALFYRRFFKRFYDIVFSGLALIALSPLLLVLTVIGAIAMRGNPFFVQPRPGKIDSRTNKETIFNLVKYRTMSNKTDEYGKLLPDEKRLTEYGKFLRRTSLDELPELISIIVGDMSIVGPRPLLVSYLERYSVEQHHRHDVRPGLTGYAQVHGRNGITWEDKFKMDIWYTQNITLLGDIQIIIGTIKTVLLHEGINSATSVTMEEFVGTSLEVNAEQEASV